MAGKNLYTKHMINNYEHYITRNIRSFYKRRLFSPIIYLILLAILWFVFPLGDIIFPVKLQDDTNFEAAYKSSDRYVKAEFKDLYFSGYTSKKGSDINGYYYYCMHGDSCSIVLLSPSTCEEGLPSIDKVDAIGKITKGKDNYSKLIVNLSHDIDWTSKGLSETVSNYYFSEPDYHLRSTIILFVFYFATMAYSLLCLILYILYIRFPFLAPAC